MYGEAEILSRTREFGTIIMQTDKLVLAHRHAHADDLQKTALAHCVHRSLDLAKGAVATAISFTPVSLATITRTLLEELVARPLRPFRIGRFEYSASKRRSSTGCEPRMPSTTRFAQSKYSRRRSMDQSAGGAKLRSRRLQILSASFTAFAPFDACVACSICRRLRAAFSSVLSSVTSRPMPAIARPNVCSSSSNEVFVSSTVSCNAAAARTSPSCSRASQASN